MRGRNGGEQNLSEEKGPLSEAPFPSEECAQRWRKMKEVKEKLLSILSKDRFFSYSERRTNRETGWDFRLKEGEN